MQLLQLSSILQTGGQFTAESHGQFSAESVVSFPRNVVVSISGISSIGTMFNNITNAFESQKALISESPDGLPPEMVLVFEVRGSIDEFFKAVSQVAELKWLAEYEKEFSPTADFNYTNNPEKQIAGKIYFVLANAHAIRELKSLWSTWKTKRQNFKAGLGKWKILFSLLDDIRPWSVKDRIEETGILEDINYRAANNDAIVPFEIELWYRDSVSQRNINKERILSLGKEYNIELINECVIPEIAYHALLMNAPINIFNDLNNDTTIRFFQSSDIMQIRPVGQSIFDSSDRETETEDNIVAAFSEIAPPIIALLDGMPIQNHAVLANRLIVFDPESFENNYPVDKRMHATAMSSIIIHGDLTDNNDPIKTKLFIRPIMKYNSWGNGKGEECIPENYLITDLIHRAVKEIKEGDANNNAVAPSIKVFNISIGDRYRIFQNALSPWAKLLDWLSAKYNILFIISAGNALEDISFSLNNTSLESILDDKQVLFEKSINYFYSKNRHRKILSPAESINAITVGSAHGDSSIQFALNNRIDLYNNENLPSPISRMGLGYRRSIKPDILARGGRMLFRRSGNDTLGLAFYNSVPPGIKAAAAGNSVNHINYTKGTSNSTAMISNLAAKIFENFFTDDTLRDSLTQDSFSVVCKALLVHGASWQDDTLELFSKSLNDENLKENISRFLGYGNVNSERVLSCTDKRVTLIGQGDIKPEEAYIYELPLPLALSGTVEFRKLTITLAYLSPINPQNQIYRTHKLWFDFPDGDLDKKLKAKRIFYDNDAVRRGTVQHEIFFSNQAQVIEEGATLRIKVNCKFDAEKYESITKAKNRTRKAIKYALVVTLDIAPQIPVDLYEYISVKIKQPVQTILR